MPITYYTEDEYKSKVNSLETNINNLCCQIKKSLNEPCRMLGDYVCCGICQFHHYNCGTKCTYSGKYLSK